MTNKINRRQALKAGMTSLLTAITLGPQAVRAESGEDALALQTNKQNGSPPPAAARGAFAALPFGDIKPRGWILAQMRRDLQTGLAGHLDELCHQVSSDIFGSGRTLNLPAKPVAALPVPTGAHGASKPHPHGPPHWWNGESEGNWRCGYLMMACLTGEPVVLAKAKAYVDHILAAQDADGYIGIFPPELRYKGDGELWTQTCLFRGLLAYAEATGDRRVDAAVQRAVDRTVAGYAECRQIHFSAHDVMYSDVLEPFYARTGDKKYLDFGLRLYNECPNLLKFQQQPEVNGAFQKCYRGGHGASCAETMRIPFWLWEATGEPKYLRLGLGLVSAMDHWIMPSGALVSDENVNSPPHPWGNVGYEYCTIFEREFTLIKAGQAVGDAADFDATEHLWFNAAQGSREPDGTAILYCSYENRLSVHDEMGRRQRFSPTEKQVAVCCAPNATRVAPYFISHAWMQPKGGAEPALAATLYGPCEVNTHLGGIPVRIEEKTNYPYAGDVEIAVHPEKPASFCLWLRNPAWSKETKIVCDGADIRQAGSFWQVRKKWKAGDTVAIHFDQAVREVPALDDEFALQYGPLLYVLPVKGERQPIRDYAHSELKDYYVSKPQEVNVDFSWPADKRDQGFGFIPTTVAESNPDFPLDNPPVVLEGALLGKDGSSVPITLVPMGAKTAELRVVTFPIAQA